MNEKYPVYLGNDLGANYHKRYTEFVLWAPVSEEVTLILENNSGDFVPFNLNKEDNGVFRLIVKGNHLNKKYYYRVKNNNQYINVNDPWGKGVSLNSEYSAVVDTSAIDKIGKVKLKSEMKSYLDAIIYELHIRDFTEDKHTDIVDKRHYLGLVEHNRKTQAGNPAGLDYLKYLGITHVQLLPVLDFYGSDDLQPLRGYNWGYNPISYFALEGSFSHNPEIPQSRLEEFKTMVNELHKNDIRVILDVVYNHVYEYKNTHWQKLVPDYFFRHLPDGSISESSGCGNDFASETPMGRKMIIDSLKYLLETYDVDGFRFDLMGIIDYQTINMAYEELKIIKPDIMFYGEGWNMPTALDESLRASADNFAKMPHIGFFNDTFRDKIKGATFDLGHRGFICGSLEDLPGVRYVLRGSVVNNPYPARFINPGQSINYIECHDNHTLYDKLIVSNAEESDSEILQRIKFANSVVMFAFGVPFFHMGQEIGASKFGLGNSYNVVKVNNMSWKLVDERFDMVMYFHFLSILRKHDLPFLHIDDTNITKDLFSNILWDKGLLYLIGETNSPYFTPYKKVIFICNPSKENKQYELDDYYAYLSAKKDSVDNPIYIKNGIIPACSIQILYLKD